MIDRFWGAAVTWALPVVGAIELAQDAVQEAFISAFRHLRELREPRAFPAWLRRHPDDARLPDENTADVTQEDPAKATEESELLAGIRAAVRALPDHERSVTENGFGPPQAAPHQGYGHLR